MDVLELSNSSCRLCLSEADFNMSLFGNYARRTNIIEKILVCLEVVIDFEDQFTTICYKCAGNIEKYYDFMTVIKRSQYRLKFKKDERHVGLVEESFNRRVRYVREEVVDADYTRTFSFLENAEEKKEKSKSHLFSYMSPANVIAKNETDVWKTPRRFSQERNCSPDLFETQSQDEAPQDLDRKLTPDDKIIERVRQNIFDLSCPSKCQIPTHFVNRLT